MLRQRLLQLYPPAWRKRYGEEFLETLGSGPLHPQQAIDIVSGAIDAWLSADVRRAAAGPSRVAKIGGGSMTLKSVMVCGQKQYRATVSDGLKAAAVMLAVTWLMTMAGGAARNAGWLKSGAAIGNFAFLAALTVSMPIWVTKGQPWKAQAAIVAVTLMLLLVLAVLP